MSGRFGAKVQGDSLKGARGGSTARDRGDGPPPKRGYSHNRPVDRASRGNRNNGSKGEKDKAVASQDVEDVKKDVKQPEKAIVEEKQEEPVRSQEEIEREQKLKTEEEEKNSLQEFISDVAEKIQFKDKLRKENRIASENRPDESYFTKLDSSVKKNTAFIKKLKSFTESQKDSLIKDVNSLNLTKYIGEVATAVTEAKLKMSDVFAAVEFCSLMYQKYSDFSQALLENWHKYLLNKKDEKISNASKYRVDLRFFAELIAAGVFTQKEGLHVLANQLSYLVSNDKEHNNLSIISSFCKHCGDSYVGLVPRKYRLLGEKYNVEIPRHQFLLPERQKACRNLLGEYYTSLCKHVIKEHGDLKVMERNNRKTLQTKGELGTERKGNFEAALTAFQKLHQNAATFCDLLDEAMPGLPEEDGKSEENGVFDIFNSLQNIEYMYDGDKTLFEDEETRSFYETLPELRAYIPGILYKESEHTGAKEDVKGIDNRLEEDVESLQIEDVEMEMETEQIEAEENKKAVEEHSSNGPKQKDNGKEGAMIEEHDLLSLEIEAEEEADVGTLMKSQCEAFIQSLPNCVNIGLIDRAAIDFCMNFNTKVNRKKLVKAMFTVHRTRYDLLPFYSRLIATLYPCMPEVANDMVQLLKGDFKWHMRKKDQINIESKLKTVRFIGEMVKFKMFPKSEALLCIKMLMFDFSHHNIEMACALLEACGRFLYRTSESHYRTKIYLEVMMRKKAALHLETRYQTMIENAYYYSNPPDVQLIAKKIRPPIHEYIRKLLYKDLSKNTTEKVLRQMRKLDWDDPDIAFYITKCLTAVWNVKYNAIHSLANLLAGLAPYHEHVAIQVVDGVLEDIRLGMEVNHPRYNQRRVSGVKFLGELYNYRMVESAVIFKTLYSLITFGVSMDESVPSLLDPPEHLFRIRLVCVILETCGQFFDKGSSKKKLDCFLVYFQRYYWFKRALSVWSEEKHFPIDVENLVRDTFETVRPKTKVLQNYEEATNAADELEKEYKAKIANILPVIEDGGDGGDGDIASDSSQNLSTIQEADEPGAFDELSQNLSHSQTEDIHTSGTFESETSLDNNNSESDDEDYGDSGDSGDSDYLMDSAGEEEDDVEDEFQIITGGPKHVKCTEDEDFLSAFDKMMSENIQARYQESLKVPQLDIAVPMHLKGKKKITELGPEQPVEPVSNNAINFVLMTRKGNKQQFSTLHVPIDAKFAAKFKEREEAERAEKEKMKQVVLDIHERQEEEDYQELIASLNRPAPINTNRERRIHYQHPKGAPDADLIFGSKKR